MKKLCKRQKFFHRSSSFLWGFIYRTKEDTLFLHGEGFLHLKLLLLAKQAGKGFRQGGLKAQHVPGYRVGQGKLAGVQGEAPRQKGVGLAVQIVPHHRAAQAAYMHPDLVGAPGEQLQFDKADFFI